MVYLGFILAVQQIFPAYAAGVNLIIRARFLQLMSIFFDHVGMGLPCTTKGAQ